MPLLDEMTYAYVQDVAERWENYERLATALGDALPDGLIHPRRRTDGLGRRTQQV